jgi:hypothetical protein
MVEGFGSATVSRREEVPATGSFQAADFSPDSRDI